MLGSLSRGSKSSLVSSYRTATPFDHLTRGFSSETPLSIRGLIEKRERSAVPSLWALAYSIFRELRP